MSKTENYILVGKFVRDFRSKGDYTADGLIAVISQLIDNVAHISRDKLCEDGRITTISSIESIIEALDQCREEMIRILTENRRRLH